MNVPMDGSATVARRVLIVGDPALSRGLMRMVLSRIGYVVTCAAGAEEARAALAHTRFALVMVALRLPDGAGPPFARRLRQAAVTAAAASRDGGPSPVPPPRVLLFGDAWDQEAVLQECRAAGLDGYLPKPISIGRLVATVRELTREAYDPAAGGVPANTAGAAATPTAEPAPVDLAHLAAFTDGDGQLERELGSLYVATATRYLAEMRAALDAGEPWDDPAHALKGASASIGAREVAALAAEAERVAEPDADLLAGVEAAFALAQGFLEERCGSGALRELDGAA